MKQKLLLMVLALGMCSIGVIAQNRELKVESDGFRWYKVTQNGKNGAENENGKTIIPTRYDFIWYHKEGKDQGWFNVNNSGEEGVYERDGSYIIPTTRGYTIIFKHIEDEGVYYKVKKNGKEGACDASGREIIAPQYKLLVYSPVSHTFKYVNSSGEYVNTGIPLTGGSSYASSNSGSSSSSSSSGSSSNTSSSNTNNSWLYKGIYYSRYNDGMQMGSTVTNEITIYKDRMEIVNVTGGVRSATSTYPFYGNQNGTRVYRSVTGSGQWRIEANYFVNDNYDIRELINGREIVEFVKEGQSFGSANGGNASGYSNGNTGGYGSSTSSTKTNGNNPRQQYTKTCGVCHGTGKCQQCGGDGWVTVMGIGKDHDCVACRNHDGRCTSCRGRGTWKE